MDYIKKIVMPIELTNAIEIFKRMINNLFLDILDERVVEFLDDVLIYSHIAKKHFKLLHQVFTHLNKHVFCYKLSKFSFFQSMTTLLGLILPLKVWTLVMLKCKA